MCGSLTIFIKNKGYHSEKKVEQGLSAIQVLCLTLKNFLNKLWATEKMSCRGEEKKIHVPEDCPNPPQILGFV